MQREAPTKSLGIEILRGYYAPWNYDRLRAVHIARGRFLEKFYAAFLKATRLTAFCHADTLYTFPNAMILSVYPGRPSKSFENYYRRMQKSNFHQRARFPPSSLIWCQLSLSIVCVTFYSSSNRRMYVRCLNCSTNTLSRFWIGIMWHPLDELKSKQ